ncbi:Unknown protein, partial [Striga hermonthica]
ILSMRPLNESTNDEDRVPRLSTSRSRALNRSIDVRKSHTHSLSNRYNCNRILVKKLKQRENEQKFLNCLDLVWLALQTIPSSRLIILRPVSYAFHPCAPTFGFLFLLARGIARAWAPRTSTPTASASPSPARTRLRASAPHARAILRAILSLPPLCAYAPSTPMPSRCRTLAFALHPRAFLRAQFQLILSRACRRAPVFPRTLPACTPNARASPPDARLSPIRPSATPVQPSCSPGSITTSASFPPPLSTSFRHRESRHRVSSVGVCLLPPSPVLLLTWVRAYPSANTLTMLVSDSKLPTSMSAFAQYHVSHQLRVRR